MEKYCPKCNSQHTKNGIYCSRSCANSRGPRSEDFKSKVRKKLVKYNAIEKNCEFCKEKFTAKENKIGRFCSVICMRKSPFPPSFSEERKNDASKRMKKMYADGKQVYGGRTKWINYKNIKVQGTYEYRTCVILDKWKDTNKILDWRYTNDRIQYTNSSGKESTYLLDFKVIDLDGSFYYIETKGFIRENDKLKWASVEKENIELLIWFFEDIVKEEQIAGLV